ncbi:hypothetical protein PLICRDRAFT_99732 [Plicaturopsis crispa FD-325 SS-3]|nr:hypothetical protein PLICRDRAFT_99732 [Plicaturopsis crispa FD-325 SS-3]
MTTHALREAFQAVKPAFGAWLTLPGAFHARTMAESSPHLSWILVDCEHGLVSLQPGAAENVAAIESIGRGKVSTIIRIPATGASASTSWQIKYALDAGARGILVPMVSTAEKAREIVADARFPPVGRRGFGSPFVHGNWGLSTADYFKAANDSVVVIIQIENKEGVDNLEEIAKVDGLDVLFIGPFDLSLALGFPTPSPDPHPEVEKVIQRILTVSHAAGKKCAIFCTSGAQGAKRAAQGFDMINVTTDTGSLTEGLAKNLAAAASQ